uniref:Protein kinase C and casein kinase substrate in neurons 2 n=1 Tax=Nothobranchius kadleci TaxID=1051664 RepID=A0A1A8E2Z7_NOTKA
MNMHPADGSRPFVGYAMDLTSFVFVLSWFTSHVFICEHVNKPSLTVFHVVSLTVPTITAPVNTNPFEDDEDEDEETAEEKQEALENHVTENKQEIKTLVNRRKHSSHLQPPCPFLLLLRSPFVPRLVFLCLGDAFPSFVFLRLQVVMLLCMVSEWCCTQTSVCVCPTLLTVLCFCRMLSAVRMEAHVSAVGTKSCLFPSYSQILSKHHLLFEIFSIGFQLKRQIYYFK